MLERGGLPKIGGFGAGTHPALMGPHASPPHMEGNAAGEWAIKRAGKRTDRRANGRAMRMASLRSGCAGVRAGRRAGVRTGGRAVGRTGEKGAGGGAGGREGGGPRFARGGRAGTGMRAAGAGKFRARGSGCNAFDTNMCVRMSAATTCNNVTRSTGGSDESCLGGCLLSYRSRFDCCSYQREALFFTPKTSCKSVHRLD